MSTSHRITISVQVDDLDGLGHVNGAVYLRYVDEAAWHLLRTAGIDQDALLAHRVAPVRLEETVRYHRELRAGDEVDVHSSSWGTGKTFRRHTRFLRDGSALAAEVVGVGGMFDLNARCLTADPVQTLRAVATRPAVLGLDAADPQVSR